MEKRRANVKKGKDSNFWRGGITKDRNLIGAWTTNNAKKVHEKYNYTCQRCGKGASNLHAHHIIPVTTDKSKAYDFDNLITVCQKCHSKIHKSQESEISFAKYVLGSNFKIQKKEWGKHKKKRIGNKLKVHYVKILSIEYIGKEMTYDIEVDGINNNFVANGLVVHNSARYKELKEDKLYIPPDWPEQLQQDLIDFTIEANEFYHNFIDILTPKLGRKRAKESARFFKTMNSQITMDVMFNWRSFYHFLNLRDKPDAQKEIREIAQQMLHQVKNIDGNPFEHTINAFKL